MLQASHDLLSTRKVVLNCRESMLTNNIIVVLMRLLLRKIQHESWNLLNNPR